MGKDAMANSLGIVEAVSWMIEEMDERKLKDLAKRIPVAHRKIGVFVPKDIASVLTAIKMIAPQITLSSLIADMIRKVVENDPNLLRLYEILQETKKEQKKP